MLSTAVTIVKSSSPTTPRNQAQRKRKTRGAGRKCLRRCCIVGGVPRKVTANQCALCRESAACASKKGGYDTHGIMEEAYRRCHRVPRVPPISRCPASRTWLEPPFRWCVASHRASGQDALMGRRQEPEQGFPRRSRRSFHATPLPLYPCSAPAELPRDKPRFAFDKTSPEFLVLPGVPATGYRNCTLKRNLSVSANKGSG
jgi:hypothetical protein